MHTLIISLLLVISTTTLYAQKNAEEQAIIDEGKKLYRSEMASWYGTDLFLERFPEKRNSIGGYFSYLEKETAKCVFFSNADIPKVLATISFDSTYNINTAKIDVSDRVFTTYENVIYSIRQSALALIESDSLFHQYENSNLNLIPLVEGESKRVFVLTGPTKNNVVLFGNDYLILFGKDNQIVSKKRLHYNLLPVEYASDKKMNGEEAEGSAHTHLPETGDLITSTDICTLMLYQKFAGWRSHIVVSEKNMCIWNCETNTLAVIPREVIEKIKNDK